MGIALGKVELLELISEALQINEGRHKGLGEDNLQH
jgi:hypothetical protein